MITSEIKELLQKARESLAAAELLLDRDFAGFATSRAYYAMFYAAEAILLSRGLSFSKHASVIAAFGQHFAKPKLVPPHLHRYFLDAFDMRQVGDYGAPGIIAAARARQVLSWAREFVEVVVAFLNTA